MTKHTARTDPERAEVAMPDTDDPVVLQELLRQAREQLRHYSAFDEVMADNLARSQALLAEAGRNRQSATSITTDPEIASALASLRVHLTDALAALDDLQHRLVPPPSGHDAESGTDESVSQAPHPPHSTASTDTTPVRTDVLIHNIGSPALARSAQSHLVDQSGVTRADVRELAEGLLRITVESAAPLTAAALTDWEPARTRKVRTARPGVLEIELDDPAPS